MTIRRILIRARFSFGVGVVNGKVGRHYQASVAHRAVKK